MTTAPHSAGSAPVADALRTAEAVVDVRSPAEFAKGHIAGAVNLPLFSNDERAEIGTLYKALGKQQAIGKGLELLGERLRTFVEGFAPYRASRLVVYCARGGMRSAAVVGLLTSLGYRAAQLPGGYKAFRNHALAVLEHGLPPHLIVIHGATGVGKTRILQRLPNHLDLEDCAQHRSSVFGAVNLTPRTQQQFDAELLAALERLDFGQPVWVEGESRKIGDVIMPDALRRRMQEALCVLVTAPLEARIRCIMDEYAERDERTFAQWEAALRQLTAPLGHARVEAMVERLRARDLAPVVGELLERHYDPRYAHAMRNYRYALTVDSTDLDRAVAELTRFAAEHGPTAARAARGGNRPARGLG